MPHDGGEDVLAITIRGVEYDLWKELGALARDRGMLAATLLNEAIRRYLDQEQKPER